MRAVFDAEADGHLEQATRVWCGSFYDIDSKEVFTLEGARAVAEQLNDLELVIGHNLTGYDFPLLEKLLENDMPAGLAEKLSEPTLEWCFDTYEGSIALAPERPQRHSVEGWSNYLGLGSKVQVDDWCNPDLIDLYIHRCEKDVYLEYRIFVELLEEMGVKDYSELFG